MNPVYILRLIRGYVVFEISGGFVERFINLCAINKIPIWDVEINNSNMTACVLCGKFGKLRAVVKKSGCRLRIINKCGLPFYIKSHKERSGLIFSAVFLVIFFTVMNQFIWITEVTGTDTVSHEEITSYVAQNGLKVGSFAPSVDTVAISRDAVNHFNGRLMWMAINIKGSKAVIEVRDYIDEHTDAQFGDPCNILADFDGKIISVEVINGDKEIHEGSAVKKGDLLISGVLENRDMSTAYCEARGKITALHSINNSYSFPETEGAAHCTDIKTLHSLYIFGLRIPLGYLNKENYTDISEYSDFLYIDGNTLPFGLIKSVYFKKTISESKGSDELLLCLDSYTFNFYDKYKNTSILSSELTLNKSSEGYTVSESIECIDFIGKPSPIYAEFYEN